MRILAVTGGIASGKSTVTSMLGLLGAPTISADALARDLLRPGTKTAQAVLNTFPACADPLQGDAIDRRVLGRLIFADKEARERLEALTHPAIIDALHQAAEDWRALPGGCAAIEIPLLFEVKLEKIGDWIVVAACSEQQQIERLQTRLGIGKAEARQQIKAQWPLEEKKMRAHFVIDTGGTLAGTENQVHTLWEKLCLW